MPEEGTEPQKNRVTDSELEQFSKTMRMWARDMGKAMDDPEDDWDPFFLFRGEESATQVIAAKMIMKDKDRTAFNIVPELIYRFKATMVGFITSSWSVKSDSKADVKRWEEWVADHPDTSLELYPGHIEQVMILAITKDDTIVHMAQIHRSPDAPPRLSRFQRMPDAAGMSGRFIDPMRAALHGKKIVRHEDVKEIIDEITSSPVAQKMMLQLFERSGVTEEEIRAAEEDEELHEKIMERISKAWETMPEGEKKTFDALLAEMAPRPLTGNPEGVIMVGFSGTRGEIRNEI